MITSELEWSPAHSQVWAGTQPQPLEIPLSAAGCCSQTSEHWCEQFMSYTDSGEWALSLTWAFLLLGTPTRVPVSRKRVKYKQPKWSQARSHPAVGASRLLQEQEPAQFQQPADTGQCRITMRLSFLNHSVCAWSLCTCFIFSHKAEARGRKAEHQRHIYLHSADGKHLPGHRLSFLPSKRSLK